MNTNISRYDGPRLLRGDELGAANRLSNLCFGGIDHAPEEEDQRYTPPRRGGIYVLAEQGRLVSQVGIYDAQLSMYDCVLRVASIGGVCTHPDQRGKGLANQLMEFCTAKLVAEGARLMLISGTRGLYSRLGNVPHGRFRYFDLKPGQDAPPQPADLLLRRMTPADLPAVIRMYQAEPLHYLRTHGEFAEALQHPDGNSYIHSEQWIVERSGQAAAYLFVGCEWGVQREDGVRQMSEYAGSRQAIAESLSALTASGTFQQLSWPVPWQDSELIHWMDAYGYSGTWRPLDGHTWRIVNFPGLMRDLRPLLRARLSAELRRGLRFEQSGALLAGDSQPDRYAILRGPERLELDGAALTRLVFGTADDQPVIEPLSGALAEVVAALFPLPSFLPGLNYR